MTDASPAPATPPPAAPPPAAPPPKSRYLLCNVLALLVAAGCYGAAKVSDRGPARTGPPTSFEDQRWNDGKAEVSRYDAERVIYAKPRAFELIQVVVKEPFDPATRTKPDSPRPGTVDAIKLVRIEDAPSGRLYRYRQTLTLRVARSDPWRLLDAACGSQEWCGNTYALLEPRGAALVKHVHSYFDGEGDKEESFPPDTLVEDQLLLALRRGPLDKSVERTVPLLGSLVANKHPDARPAAAKVALLADETVATGAGDLACAHVKVEREALPVLEFWIAKEAPHLLARWSHGDGRRGTLRSVERTVYWRD